MRKKKKERETCFEILSPSLSSSLPDSHPETCCITQPSLLHHRLSHFLMFSPLFCQPDVRRTFLRQMQACNHEAFAEETIRRPASFRETENDVRFADRALFAVASHERKRLMNDFRSGRRFPASDSHWVSVSCVSKTVAKALLTIKRVRMKNSQFLSFLWCLISGKRDN